MHFLILTFQVGKENVFIAKDLIDYPPELEPAMRHVFGSVFICTSDNDAKKVDFLCINANNRFRNLYTSSKFLKFLISIAIICLNFFRATMIIVKKKKKEKEQNCSS